MARAFTGFSPAVEPRLKLQIEDVRIQFEKDLKEGGGYVRLPKARTRKYPNAGRMDTRRSQPKNRLELTAALREIVRPSKLFLSVRRRGNSRWIPMKKPMYYVAVFGKPGPPDKDTVDSGRYPLGIRGTDTPGERGDILLLYCTASHEEYSGIVSGIGVILTKNREAIYYRYLPFSSTLSRDQIERTFTDEDRRKLTEIKFNTYWLFEISSESFSNATRGVEINWP